MQIVESTAWALRSARLTLISAQSKVRITLFPMLHVGTPEYFEAVFADAFEHDVVLVEGVKSPSSKRIGRSYRWIQDTKAMNLVIQPAYPISAQCRATIVNADLSGEEFTKVWRNIPLYVRASVFFLAPAVGIARRWFGSRKTLAKGMTLDDLAERREVLDLRPETLALARAILRVRDARLTDRLREQLAGISAEPRRIAVVYGARHMRAVLRDLSRRGFHVSYAEWLTVFPI